MTKKQIYLLLDSKSAPFGPGVLETAPDGSVLQILSWMEKRMRSHSMRLSSWWEWRAVDWPYNVSCFGSGERGFL